MNFEDPKTLVLFGAAGVFAITVLMAVLRDLRMARWIVAGMLFFSALAPQSDRTGWYNAVWLKPLQERRAELYAAGAVMLLLAALVHKARTSLRVFPAPLVLLFVIGLMAGLLDLRTFPQDGALRVALSICAIVGGAMVVPSILETWEDFLALVRALGWVGVLWLACVAVQVMIAPNQMLMGAQSRFVGMLGNPQGTAVFLAPQLTVVAWLALNEPGRRKRWIWIATLGGLLVLLAWTGSRTGALMTMVGLMAVLYARMGRAIFILPLVLGALYGLLTLATMLGITLPLDRLVSTQDTRTDAWKMLLNDAMQAPLLGEGLVGARAVENSFLLGWVVYGPIMALLIVVTFFATVFLGVRVWQCRPYVAAPARRMIDLVLGYFVMYWIGANFEWYVVARIEPNIPLMVCFACIAGSIIRHTRAARWDAEHIDAAPVYEELPGAEASSG